MKVLLGVALLLLVAFLGSRWTFTRVRIPIAARHLYLTGIEYLLVGVCLGSLLLGVLDERTLEDLQPLINLSLGWIGLLFGIGLDLAQIRRLPLQYLGVTAIQAIAVLAATALPLLSLLAPHASDGTEVLLAALALGAAAVPTAQSQLALWEQERRVQGSAAARAQGSTPDKVLETLRYVAGIDAAFGLIPFGVLFCLAQTRSLVGVDAHVPVQFLALSLLLGVTIGLLLQLLTRLRCTEEELRLFTVGIVVLGAGSAALFKLSALFVNTVAGIVIANRRGEKLRIARALVLLEKPFYLVVIVVAGARVRLDPGTSWVLGVGLAFLALRLVGKLGGGLAGALLLRRPVRLPAALGLGLFSHGGMAAAMVLSFESAFPGPLAKPTLLIALLAIVLADLSSPALLRRLLARRGA